MVERVTLCSGCLGAQARPLAEALRSKLPVGSVVGLTDCMNVCGQPAAISLRAKGKVAYLFAGVDVPRQIDQIVAMAGLYAASTDGRVEDARPIGDLRLCLIGRIPA